MGKAQEALSQEGENSTELLELESDLQHREAALRQWQAGAKERQDSAASLGRESLDRELQGPFLDTSLLTENRWRKADLDSSIRERRPTFLLGQLSRHHSNLKSLLKPLALQEASPSEAHRVGSIH